MPLEAPRSATAAPARIHVSEGRESDPVGIGVQVGEDVRSFAGSGQLRGPVVCETAEVCSIVRVDEAAMAVHECIDEEVAGQVCRLRPSQQHVRPDPLDSAQAAASWRGRLACMLEPDTIAVAPL